MKADLDNAISKSRCDYPAVLSRTGLDRATLKGRCRANSRLTELLWPGLKLAHQRRQLKSIPEQ